MIKVKRCPGGFFGNLWLPGPRELLFRFNYSNRAGDISIGFHVSLWAKIQPANAMELAIQRARDAFDKVSPQ